MILLWILCRLLMDTPHWSVSAAPVENCRYDQSFEDLDPSFKSVLRYPSGFT